MDTSGEVDYDQSRLSFVCFVQGDHIMFERIARTDHLHSMVMEQIRALITEGKISSGDRLPTEREMADQFGVSRTVIRDAIKILSGHGILDVRHGSGIFVASVNSQQVIERLSEVVLIEPHSMQSLFDVRVVLETASIAWAAERVSKMQCEALLELLDQSDEIVSGNSILSEDQLITLGEMDSTFHLQICTYANNPVLDLLMKNLLDLLAVSRHHSLRIPDRAQRSIAEHRAIVDALKSSAPHFAKEAMINHLNSVFESIKQNSKSSV